MKSPQRESGCGSGSEGTRDSPSGLERKTGRVTNKAILMRFKKNKKKRTQWFAFLMCTTVLVIGMILRNESDITRYVFATFVFTDIEADHIAFLQFVEIGINYIRVVKE